MNRNAPSPSLFANLQQVLSSRKHENGGNQLTASNTKSTDDPAPSLPPSDATAGEKAGFEVKARSKPVVLVANGGSQLTESTAELTESTEIPAPSSSRSDATAGCEAILEVEMRSKPVVLVTNGDGIESPGLVFLVDALVRCGRFDVHVCAPQFDKSASGHSFTVRETVEVSTAEISGATAFEVSGTPADCVSLALSQALVPWAKPVLVISGINRGLSCGQNIT